MSLLIDMIWELLALLVIDGFPSLFRRNLPKPVHRLRVSAWILVLVCLVCFVSVYVPSFEAHRGLLKRVTIGSMVFLMAVMVTMTLLLKAGKTRS